MEETSLNNEWEVKLYKVQPLLIVTAVVVSSQFSLHPLALFFVFFAIVIIMVDVNTYFWHQRV